MSETATEIFYLLSFSIGTGVLLSKTLCSLLRTWQDDEWLEKNKNKRYRP
jgi:hypothetical protein